MIKECNIKPGATFFIPAYYKGPVADQEVIVENTGLYYTSKEPAVFFRFTGIATRRDLQVLKLDFFCQIAHKHKQIPENHVHVSLAQIIEWDPCLDGLQRAVEFCRKHGYTKTQPIDLYDAYTKMLVQASDIYWICRNLGWTASHGYEEFLRTGGSQ